MTTVTIAAFFDSPGLLGVRLALAEPDEPISRFVRKAPDHGPQAAEPASSGEWLPAVLAVGGMAVACGVIGGLAYLGWQGEQAFTSTGSFSQTYTGPERDSRPRDSTGGTTWASSVGQLGDDLAPARPDLRPFASRTLLDAPRDLQARGKSTPAWLAPQMSPSDQQAHDLGRLLGDHLRLGDGLDGTAIVLDLPGGSCVAAAAGLSQIGDLIFTMDNLPHPRGVVPSQETLASILYWRAEILANRSAQTANRIPVFVLDSNRLSPYQNEVDRFDNRSRIHLPSVSALRSAGVTQVIYVRPTIAAVTELDDLNETFVAFAADGLPVRYLGLDAVADASMVQVEAPRSTTSAAMDVPRSTTTAATAGGGSAQASNGHSAWMWYYLMMSRSTPVNAPRSTVTSYRAAPRPVGFSATAWDGGASNREQVWGQYATRSTSGSSGGSWSRSFHSSSSSGG